MTGRDDRGSTGSAPAAPAARSGFRARVEEVSHPLLVRLSRLPKLAIPLLTVAVLAVGVLAPPAVGIPALLLVALWMAWLGYLSWPVVSTGQKLMRLATVAILLVAVGFRIAPL